MSAAVPAARFASCAARRAVYHRRVSQACRRRSDGTGPPDAMRRLVGIVAVALAATVALAPSHAGAQASPAPPGAPVQDMPAVRSAPDTPGAQATLESPCENARSRIRRPTWKPVAPKTPPGSMAERFAATLRLDDKQKAEWEAAERETKVIVAPLVPRVRDAQCQLEAALKQGETGDVVKERVDALAAINSEIRRARTDMERRLTAVLTPEQRRKYEIITRR
jgi:LTXXQ motif family protein